jgi:hypothetical protein
MINFFLFLKAWTCEEKWEQMENSTGVYAHVDRGDQYHPEEHEHAEEAIHLLFEEKLHQNGNTTSTVESNITTVPVRAESSSAAEAFPSHLLLTPNGESRVHHLRKGYLYVGKVLLFCERKEYRTKPLTLFFYRYSAGADTNNLCFWVDVIYCLAAVRLREAK